MKTADLKKEVLDRITEIEDRAFLEVIKTLLDYKQGEPVIMLPPSLKKRLLLASEEAKKGNVLTEEEMDEQVEQLWLKEN